MTAASRKDVTGLLLAWSKGDNAALGELMPLVYEDLRDIARRAAELGRLTRPGEKGTIQVAEDAAAPLLPTPEESRR